MMISKKLLVVVSVILCYGNAIYGDPEAGNPWYSNYPTTFPYSLSYPGYYYYSPQYYIPNYYGSDYESNLGIARHPYGGLSYVEQHGIGKRSADPGYNRPSTFNSPHVKFNSNPYSKFHIIQRHRRSAQPSVPFIKSYYRTPIINRQPHFGPYQAAYYRYSHY